VTAATVPIPQPMAVDGIVTDDVVNRVLAVRLSELAGGHARLLWPAQGYQALAQAEEPGYRSKVPIVASALGSDRGRI
jgi:hypothetical protein